MRKEDGLHIFCDGGAEIISELMQRNLVDRYIISVIPVLVGKGVLLFKKDRDFQELKLTRSVTFPSGLVQLWYEPKINKEDDSV